MSGDAAVGVLGLAAVIGAAVSMVSTSRVVRQRSSSSTATGAGEDLVHRRVDAVEGDAPARVIATS